MKTGMKRILWGGAAAAAVALIVGGAAFFPTIAQAQTATITSTVTAPDFQQPGRGTPPGSFGNGTDQSAALAKALGITAEELQAAQVKAETAAIDQQVTDGWLTQKQADALKTRIENGTGGPMGDFGRGAGPKGGSNVDSNALLADALGISVDDLQAARTTVFDDQLAQAVTDGNLTQAQADLMKARRALSEYVAPKLQTAYDDAVAAAVKAGVVTQEQADALAVEGGMGMHGFGFGPGMDDGMKGMDGGMRGMDGGMRGMDGGHGMHGGQMGPGGHGGRGGDWAGAPDIDPQNGTPDSTDSSN